MVSDPHLPPFRTRMRAAVSGLLLLVVALTPATLAAAETPAGWPPQPTQALDEDFDGGFGDAIPISQTVAPCHKQCGPLLGAVKPVEEARRVYRNCRALCDRKGLLTCPDGRQVSYRFPKACSSS